MNTENISTEGVTDIKEEKESDYEIESENGLYENHDIKEEMDIGPEVLQRVVNATDCSEDIPAVSKKREKKKRKVERKDEKKDQVEPQNEMKESSTEEIISNVEIKKKRTKVRNKEQSKFNNLQCDCKCAIKCRLTTHLRTHTGEKSISCSEHYKSASKGGLIRHLRVHTGEKPYSCAECEYKWTKKHTLVRHSHNIHTGEKPYSCDQTNELDTGRSGLASASNDAVVLDLEVGPGGRLHDSSTNRTSLGISDESFESTVFDWINNLPSNDSDDEDLNIDCDEINGIELLKAPLRTATDDIADNADLSPTQAAILQQEEESNDRLIRDLASDDYFNFTWTNERQTFTGKKEKFLGTPGPTFPVTDDTRPIDIFYKMFTSDFIDMLVTETNRYAEQTLDRLRQDPNAKKQSRLFRWTAVNRDEMLTFLAFNILQGLYPKPIEEAYFSYDGYGTTPYFKLIMSYNRYHLLKTFLHFVDNNTSTDNTKLNKIQPVTSYLNEKFSSLYKPGQEIAIDESLLKWHGRLSFSQKILTKAAKVGVKTYELCESSTGYLWSFFVYTGKDGPNRTNTDGANINDEQDTRGGPDGQNVNRPDNCSSVVRPTNATAKIVYKLVEPLLHKGHTLIMDNFYNSPLLARCLKLDGQTDVFGTLRLSREFVPEAMRNLKKTDLQQGEVAITYSSDLSVMVWRDSNLVGMISTFHSLQIGKKDNSDRQTNKPVIVLDYNKSMGGVDRKDQFLASQPLERQRNKIWYKKLFRRLYNAALFNCFVIFTSNLTHKLSHRKFRTVLAEDILKIHRKIDLTTEPRLFARRGLKLTTPTISTVEFPRTQAYVESNHFPGKSSSKSTVCRLCKKSRTAFKCLQCNVPLCILICFREYHKLASSTLAIVRRTRHTR